MNTKDRLIDLVENTRPKCVVCVDRDVYFYDIDGDIDSYGCKLTLCWYNRDYEVSVTAPYCRISPAYRGGYYMETFTINGTPDNWKYQLSTDNVSADDAESITALMEEKMCWYAFHRESYTIEHI